MFQSGLSAQDLFKRGFSLTYDDFRILDTEYTSIDEYEIDLSVNLGKGIILKTPIIASHMDTVTNAKVCVAVANMGGIGVIHMNYKTIDNHPDIEAQIKEIGEKTIEK
jgi:IMP dehydrogenase